MVALPVSESDPVVLSLSLSVMLTVLSSSLVSNNVVLGLSASGFDAVVLLSLGRFVVLTLSFSGTVYGIDVGEPSLFHLEVLVTEEEVLSPLKLEDDLPLSFSKKSVDMSSKALLVEPTLSLSTRCVVLSPEGAVIDFSLSLSKTYADWSAKEVVVEIVLSLLGKSVDLSAERVAAGSSLSGMLNEAGPDVLSSLSPVGIGSFLSEGKLMMLLEDSLSFNGIEDDRSFKARAAEDDSLMEATSLSLLSEQDQTTSASSIGKEHERR